MSSLTPFYMSELSAQPYTMMTPPSPRPLSSFESMFLSDNSSLTSQSHIFQYRLPRPLTLPCPLPKLLYLSCWWTGDLTDFWGHSLETTSPQYSELLSSHSRRNNGEHITGPMAQWREQCRMARRTLIPLPMLDPNPALHALSDHPLLLNPCPLWTLPSTHFPSWPDEPTPSLNTPEPTPFPQGINIIVTLHQLNEVGEGLTDEALLEWALDVLCSLED